MAEKTKREQLQEWKDRIELGILYQNEYGQTDKWELYEKMYRNRFSRGTLPVNLIFAFGKSMIPRVYFRNPRVTLTALKPGFSLKAITNQRVCNWLLDETGIKKEMKKLVFDAFLYGTGVGKIGYDSEFGYDEEQTNPILDGQGTLSQFDKKTEEYLEYNVNIKPGMPWFLRMRPIDFIVPWGTQDVYSAPWIAHRIMRPYDDVMADKKYENKQDLKPSKIIACKGAQEDEVYKKLTEKEKWVELWEIRDVKNRKIYTVVMDHHKFLREDVDSLQIEGLPIESLVFNDDPISFWCTSDAAYIEAQQLELNEIRTQAQKHREIDLLKILAKKNTFTKETRERILSGDVGALVEIETNEDIRSVVTPFIPHIPADLGPIGQQVIEDVRHILGFNRNTQGDYMTGRRTATEAKIVQMGADLRVDEKRDVAADLLKDIARKYLQFVWTFWKGQKKVVDIVGPDGMVHWVEFKGEEIKGEYAFRVDPENALPINTMTRREEAKELYMMTRGDPTLNPAEMSKQLLQQYEWLEPDQLVMPQQQQVPQPGYGNNPDQPLPIGDASDVIMKRLQERKAQGDASV